MERLLVSTQRRKSPKLRVGAATKVRVVEIGGGIACTITLGDAIQKVTAVVKDLKGTVVVRSFVTTR